MNLSLKCEASLEAYRVGLGEQGAGLGALGFGILGKVSTCYLGNYGVLVH